MGALAELVLGSDKQIVDKRPFLEMGTHLSIHQDQLHKCMARYLDALQQGLRENVIHGGLDALLDALHRNKSEEFLKYPQQIIESKAIDNGNYILGYVLKDKEVSRGLASELWHRTGIEQDSLELLLPMTATLLMGRLGLYLTEFKRERQRDALLDILEIEEGTALREQALQKSRQLYGE